jgi:hypothetical protein
MMTVDYVVSVYLSERQCSVFRQARIRKPDSARAGVDYYLINRIARFFDEFVTVLSHRRKVFSQLFLIIDNM